MSCKITFDVPTLSDAVSKAARVAPTKGPAFDTASGIMMEVTVNPPSVTIKSTDLTVSYQQRIAGVSAQGDDATWRIPSRLFADIIASLPMDQDSQVTLIDRGDEAVRLSCGRVMAKFHRLDPESFPKFPVPDMTDAATAHDFASKIEQVSWACDPSSDRLSGVFVDGKRLVGCSNAALAIIPCIVPVAEPIIVPLHTIAPLLKQASDLHVKAIDRKFLMRLDPESQASSVLIEGSYPTVDHVARKDFTNKIEASKNSMVEILDRMLGLIREDRQPKLRVEINGTGLLKQMIFDVDVPGVGRMQDSLDIVTDMDEAYELLIQPSILQKAVSHAKADKLIIHFGHPDPAKKGLTSISIEDEATGYQCWTMPLNPKKAKAAAIKTTTKSTKKGK